METGKKVLALGMSGGVDSSVAAWLLARQWNKPEEGRSMVGASHIIWPTSACCTAKVLNRAEELCRRLRIPYYLIDCTEQFRASVVDDFVDTYISGSTPNPCVRCNERVRFSVFYREIRETLIRENVLAGNGELYFSTGHYARVAEQDGRYFLKKALDPKKDQSYMLYKIHPAMLPYLIFPLGDFVKTDIQAKARELGLPSAHVRESQDACFVDGDYADFITEQRGAGEEPGPGDILDTSGKVLGKHRGYIRYTVGQRKGLNLGNGPWYVLRVDAAENRVIVGRKEELGSVEFSVREPNWFIPPPEEMFSCTVKIRYNSGEVPCTVHPDGDTYMVKLEERTAVTPGQSAVFYSGDLVLGGGIIEGV